MESNGYSIVLEDVSKDYDKSTNVIKNMNLKIYPGELLVFLGPSGCGKSTTLRMIAGLEDPTGGKIIINNKDSRNLNNKQRSIAMVFQDYALYPNMTVYQNLEYALKVHRVPKEERKQRLEKIMESLNLSKYKDRFPAELSGGQKQRVALGRGMAKKTNIFLLDEPLSNIDVQLREKARDQLLQLHNQNGQTILYVTHDQQEAMALGDRIAVINNGIVQMIDTPENVYHNPSNLFVAKFVGSPQINVIQVEYNDSNLITLDGMKLISNYKNIVQKDKRLLLGIRPENISISEKQETESIPVKIDAVTDYGKFKQLTIKVSPEVNLKALTPSWNSNAATAYMKFDQDCILLFDKNTGTRID
ncbi:ABC transporter ATP-binding protein [Lentilactobacillus sp. Marseille-Q4993]|uniref:ABC transporter ATP-binding protein n=1 Tax=Lentilactobacillus sp. Marseille-Q4993 TaxID=3039492 RepID=UPI0024BCD783|nr:ABC transporter ATP-binding protein [Lentilactobacillus sp. Marseille-Q4993]